MYILLQKIINLLSPLLLRYRYHNKKNPFLDFQRLMYSKELDNKNISKEKIDNGSILIAPIRVSPLSNLFEGLMGTFLQNKGQNVKFLLCNQSLTYCENKSKYGKNVFSCALCKKEQNRFIKVFKIDPFYVSSIISKEERKHIKRIINSRSFDQDSDFIYQGINLKECIISGCMRYTLTSEIKNIDKKIIRGFAYSSFVMAKASINIINKNKISHLLISHGIYSTWGSVLEVFKNKNITSTVWGRGYVGNGRLFFGHNMGYHEEAIIEDISVLNNIDLSQKKKTAVLNYFFAKEKIYNNPDFINYYENLKSINFDIQGFKSKIARFKKRYGMFTNIPWDGQVFNNTDVFPTTRFYVINTLKWFKKNPDCVLIIRAHPAEKTGSETSFAEKFKDILDEIEPVLPSNVIFLEPENPISSYDLSKMIDCAILYGSSLALEFAVRRIPVIQTGRFNVSNKNIVFDVYSIEYFYELLNSVKYSKLEISDQMYSNALKYAYYWVFLRHIIDETMALKNGYYNGFNFNNKETFMKNPTLMFIYDKMMENSKIILSDDSKISLDI